MFSALKKLTSKNSTDPPSGGTSGVPVTGGNAMDVNLQRKFGQKGGIHYNMKLIIKGDRNTGKTSLWHRLQGHAFKDEPYLPTDEIQVAHIHWNYKAADDIVKVEVWDVVDKGRPKKKAIPDQPSLKIQNVQAIEQSVVDLALDAELVDVYKGTHAVVFMLDITKMWTFEYLKREMPKVPPKVPIMVMANFVDQGHHRQVTKDQVVGFIEELGREDVQYVESSMKNGFGLKLLHQFLNIPYLFLQRRALETQLEINQRELDGARLELELFFESDEANYDVFLNGVTKKRRSRAEAVAPAPTVDVVVGQPSNTLPVVNVETAKTDKEISCQKGLEAIAAQQAIMDKKSPSKSIDDVDTFQPSTDGGIDNFLNSNEGSVNDVQNECIDSDSDGDVNPMVKKVADDLEDVEIEQDVRVRHYSNASTGSSGSEAAAPQPVVPEEPVVLCKSSDETNSDSKKKSSSSKKSHKKEKKKKRKRETSGKQRPTDLEEFLNGTNTAEDLSAGNYEEL